MGELKARGIEAISAIPADFPLTWKQAIIRDATVSGRPYVASDLARLLHGFGPPTRYLDFEAMMPPIPLYEGTRPYQTLPFQWSLHILTAGGTLEHREFLASAHGDPRRQFTDTLIAALAASDDPIVVYSGYEQRRLRELAALFFDLAQPLNAIIDRLADLLPIVRGAVYFPAFDFSNSIKTVAPALCPGFGYDDLGDIADGMAASAAFLQLACDGFTIPEGAERLRAALLAYCRRDTLALVEVHRVLMELARR
jgi:predicted RecB family nuclease